MLFSSQEFIFLFLPLFLVIYYVTGSRARNLILLAGSLFFYFTGERTWFFLIIFSILLHYIFTCLMQGRSQKKRRTYLIILLGYDFASLFFFKYMAFLIGELNRLLGGAGAESGSGFFPVPELTLPLGISFYTFQIAAYAIDVYRRPQSCCRSLVNLGAYVCMFPQLIAGPIVLYKSVAKQLKRRRVSMAGLEQGLQLFVVGLAYKMLIANVLGSLWHEIQVVGVDSISSGMAWMGALAFSLQLYFDFNGYSLMAMGLGAALGIQIPRNFKHPYMAVSITDFWRRWHITLSTWFRDYVYVPLGGNRKGSLRTVFNLFVVWALTGIWHGAGWNFLLWGIYYFLFLLVEKLFLGGFLERHHGIGWLYTILVVITGWVIFSLDDVGSIAVYLQKLFLWPGQAGAWTQNLKVTLDALRRYGIFFVTAILCATCLPENLYRKYRGHLSMKVFLLVVFWICVYRMATVASNPFLYFRF